MNASSLIEFPDFLILFSNNKLTMNKFVLRVLFFNAPIQSGQWKYLGGAQVAISSLFVIPSKYESIIS